MLKKEVVMRFKFNVGDKVTIRKPSGDHIYDMPRWVSSMDSLDGCTFKIDFVNDDTGYVRYKGWLFNQGWIEPVRTGDDVEENIHPQDISFLF